MKHSKVLISVLLGLALFALAACGGKYSDAIELSENQLEAMQTYADDLEKADSADSVIAAMNTFAAKMEKLMPQAKALRDKYPELYRPDGKLPDEFADLQKKTEAVVSRMSAASMKTIQYMMQPGVQQAMMRMNQAMQNTGS